MNVNVNGLCLAIFCWALARYFGADFHLAIAIGCMPTVLIMFLHGFGTKR